MTNNTIPNVRDVALNMLLKCSVHPEVVSLVENSNASAQDILKTVGKINPDKITLCQLFAKLAKTLESMEEMVNVQGADKNAAMKQLGVHNVL